MGIPGLLPLLRSVTETVDLASLRGLTVGVDGLVWLHRGVYACAVELARGVPSDKYVAYCVSQLNLLLHHGLKPLIVFDGGKLPAKKATEAGRAADRAAAAARTRVDGSASPGAAARAVDVTPQLAAAFVHVLRAANIPFIVAPYEADAQLAYLAREGLVDAVLTEDSDLVPYGVERVLLKLDRDAGTVQQLLRASLPANAEVNLAHFTGDMILYWCVLAGCDYLPSLPGMGVRKAYEYVRKTKTLDRLVAILRFEWSDRMPAGYLDGFQRALATFRHQRVWDPRSRRLTHVTPLPPSLQEQAAAEIAAAVSGGGGGDGVGLSFLGPWIGDEQAGAIADGWVDPDTRAPYLPLHPLYLNRRWKIEGVGHVGGSGSGDGVGGGGSVVRRSWSTPGSCMGGGTAGDKPHRMSAGTVSTTTAGRKVIQARLPFAAISTPIHATAATTHSACTPSHPSPTDTTSDSAPAELGTVSVPALPSSGVAGGAGAVPEPHHPIPITPTPCATPPTPPAKPRPLGVGGVRVLCEFPSQPPLASHGADGGPVHSPFFGGGGPHTHPVQRASVVTPTPSLVTRASWTSLTTRTATPWLAAHTGTGRGPGQGVDCSHSSCGDDGRDSGMSVATTSVGGGDGALSHWARHGGGDGDRHLVPQQPRLQARDALAGDGGGVDVPVTIVHTHVPSPARHHDAPVGCDVVVEYDTGARVLLLGQPPGAITTAMPEVEDGRRDGTRPVPGGQGPASAVVVHGMQAEVAVVASMNGGLADHWAAVSHSVATTATVQRTMAQASGDVVDTTDCMETPRKASALGVMQPSPSPPTAASLTGHKRIAAGRGRGTGALHLVPSFSSAAVAAGLSPLPPHAPTRAHSGHGGRGGLTPRSAALHQPPLARTPNLEAFRRAPGTASLPPSFLPASKRSRIVAATAAQPAAQGCHRTTPHHLALAFDGDDEIQDEDGGVDGIAPGGSTERQGAGSGWDGHGTAPAACCPPSPHAWSPPAFLDHAGSLPFPAAATPMGRLAGGADAVAVALGLGPAAGVHWSPPR